MVQHNNKFNKSRKEFLGQYLKRVRIRRKFKQKEIAKEYNINLYAIEKGERSASDELLGKLAQRYGVPLEEIMERKYWPQLRLLSCIVRPTDVAADILKDFESDLTPKEMEEIIEEIKRYTAFLLLSRHSPQE